MGRNAYPATRMIRTGSSGNVTVRTMTTDIGADDPLVAWLARPYEFALERRIFGSADAGAIRRVVTAFCATTFGSPVAAVLSYVSSLGCVFTLRLADGQHLVLKASPPQDSVASLASMARIQAHLALCGFPCPRPLGGPWPLVYGHATAMERRDEGAFVTADDPTVRRALAEALARQIALAHDFIDLPGLEPALWTSLPTDHLYPVSHLSIFDLEATAQGAGWIDRITRAARGAAPPDGSHVVVGHDDWAVKDVRFADGAIRVVYDWDSLRRDRESVIVGRAAGLFMMTYRVPHPARIAPRPDEVRAFIDEYEAARGSAFTTAERATMAAVATYMIAWTARLEHSTAPDEGDYPVGTYRDALTRYGDAYLRP